MFITDNQPCYCPKCNKEFKIYVSVKKEAIKMDRLPAVSSGGLFFQTNSIAWFCLPSVYILHDLSGRIVEIRCLSLLLRISTRHRYELGAV